MPLHMLTTIDNPYDPFTRYDEWDKWDRDHGYHTAAYLARIAVLSDDMSEADQDSVLESSIQEILSENILGVYRKVPEPSEQSERAEEV